MTQIYGNIHNLTKFGNTFLPELSEEDSAKYPERTFGIIRCEPGNQAKPCIIIYDSLPLLVCYYRQMTLPGSGN